MCTRNRYKSGRGVTEINCEVSIVGSISLEICVVFERCQ